MSSPDSKPRVHIIALGGTIAGVNMSGQLSDEYKPGVLGIEEILKTIPDLPHLAAISAEQLVNIPSYALTHEHWYRLDERMRAVYADASCAGIVVTHGTDTLEETAFFLHLTKTSPKPVVVTGAMRPATAISADGPHNLLVAVATAATLDARDRGILVALNGNIDDAVDVRKCHTTAVDAFRSPNWGPLGRFIDDRPRFFRASPRPYGGFDGTVSSTWPRVAVLHGHSHGEPDLVEAVVAQGARGIVHAGMGNGGIAPPVRDALRKARRTGVAIVSSSFVPAGPLTLRSTDVADGFIVDRRGLGPLKCRILLCLALQKHPDADVRVFQEIFDRY